MEFKYDVFFSYRHKPLDNVITARMFNEVESYRLPAVLKEEGYQDIRHAFRDTEELPVSRILTETIDSALHSSKGLIVVCSTDTPYSEWVDREVETFIELGRASFIYPLLISGDPERSFPPSLKLVPDIMDRVMDIRCSGNNVRRMTALAKERKLKAIAGIVGCPEEVLVREHTLRRNRKFLMRAFGAAAVLTAAALISLGLMKRAQDYRDMAMAREAASLQILQELTYELPDHLTNIPGAYSKISDILQRNTEDLNRIIMLSADKSKAEFEAAANYEKLAAAGSVLGNYEDALAAEEKAIVMYEELLEEKAEGALQALASAHNNRGSIFHSSGMYAEAQEEFAAALQMLSGAEGADPLTLARICHNAGSNAVSMGDPGAAQDWFSRSLSVLADLDDTPEVMEARGLVSYSLGVLLYRSGNYQEASGHLTESLRQYEKVLAVTDTRITRGSIVKTASVLAACLTDMGRFDEADSYYAQAIGTAEELAQDLENYDYQHQLAELYNNRGLNRNIQGDYRQADRFYTLACERSSYVYAHTGTASDAAFHALTLLNTGENAFKLQDYARSKDLFEEGLAVYGGIIDNLGDYDKAQYQTWLSYCELIHNRDYDAALQASLLAYRLQPDNVLVNLNLAYACLYNGYYDECDQLLRAVAALGEGQARTIRVDLEAQHAAGLTSDRMPVVDENGEIRWEESGI